MLTKQPKMDIPKNRFEVFFDIVGILVFAVSTIYLITVFGSLPDQVPGHYNAAGEVDRWGSKMELWILPAVAFFILWLPMTVLERYPHTFNYLNLNENNIEAQYRNGRLMLNVMKNECVLLFSWLNYQSIRVAEGSAEGLGTWFMPVFLVVIFGTMAFFVVRMLRL